MTSLMKTLLTPLPVEERVTPQVLQPLYHSTVLDTLFGGSLRICREGRRHDGRFVWELLSHLRVEGAPNTCEPRVVRAVPPNDPLRPLPKRARLESVWTLMAYLYELGPVDAPMAAVVPIKIEDRRYVAYWGEIERVGYRLHLVLEETQQPQLRKFVDDALLLISTKE